MSRPNPAVRPKGPRQDLYARVTDATTVIPAERASRAARSIAATHAAA